MPFTPVKVSPLKVATPAAKVPEVAPAVMAPPAPETMLALAVPVLSPVSTLPPESSTLTTGCWLSAAPEASLALGEVVMTSLEAAPVAMAMLFELALVKLSPVKLNW